MYERDLRKDFGTMSSMQNFLLLSYSVFDWLSIDLKGGVGNIKQHPVGSDRIDYPTFLGGGYGFRIKFYDRGPSKAVFGFQHISIHPHTIFVGGTKHKAVLDDWQVSALYSYDCKIVTPYIGTKWSRSDYIHWVDGERKRIKSDGEKGVGIVFGFDVPFCKNMWLNLEGQFVDTQAMAASINYSF